MDEFIKYIKDKYRLQDFEACISEIETDLDNALKENPVPNKPDNCSYLLEALGKSLVTTREILLLCSYGLPDGALSLARNLCEQFIITAYIEAKKENESFDEMLAKYFDDYEVRRLKNLKVCFPEREAEADAELAKIKVKYNITSKKISDYWWSDRDSFRNILEEVKNNAGLVGLIGNIHELYKEACSIIHASFLGNTARLGSTSSAIEMGPWENGQEKSLYVCAVSLICTVCYTYDELGIEDRNTKKIIDKLNELGVIYWDLINE